MIGVSVSYHFLSDGGYSDVRIIVIHLESSVSRWKEGKKRHDCLKVFTQSTHCLALVTASVRNPAIQVRQIFLTSPRQAVSVIVIASGH
jgi:hypothetical protein